MGTPSFQPQMFGKYCLVDRIATGGMAEIFKAKTFAHGGFEHLVVIKRILPHIGDQQDFVDMFADEAKVSVALQHANIVRVYDFGTIVDTTYLAMECVDGKDVRNVLKALGRRREHLSPRFAAFVAFEVAKGLHYAHTKADSAGRAYEIVHRDISASNVLVSYDGEIKIADFGIAKAGSNAYHTADGVLKGKFEYMSPEQAQGQPIDARSDVFSLGVVLYEMSTGRRPFKADSDLATLARIRAGDFTAPRAVRPDLPMPLEQICLKALHADPAERYQSAREMGDALWETLLDATPEGLRLELSAFLRELFATEIRAERKRLEDGNALARQLHDRTPLGSLEGRSTSAATLATVPSPRRNDSPWLVVIGGLLALSMVGTALVGVVYAITRRDAPAAARAQPAPDAVAAVSAAASGTTEVRSLDRPVDRPSPEPATPTVAVAGDAPPDQVVDEDQAPSRSEAPATLTVTLVGGGWAHVWIDGAALPKTAPFRDLAVPTGRHEIRIENSAAGVDLTESHTFVAGENVVVRAVRN